jgi:hypothetical protein
MSFFDLRGSVEIRTKKVAHKGVIARFMEVSLPDCLLARVEFSLTAFYADAVAS